MNSGTSLDDLLYMSTSNRYDMGPVEQVWRRNRYLGEKSITIYRQWVFRFSNYCLQNQLEMNSELTARGVEKFATAYSQSRSINKATALHGAKGAMHALSFALCVLQEAVPPWDKPTTNMPIRYPLAVEFSVFLSDVRGNPDNTVKKKRIHVEKFLSFLRERSRRIQRVRLVDIDDYVLDCTQQYAHSTTADICSTLRMFLRFLHITGRVQRDYADSAATPKVRPNERPPRALPWESVQQILLAVDRSSLIGIRDHALLLTMCAYGLGAGEVIGITLDDIKWRTQTLRIVRPKNGVEILLPLLPAVSHAIVEYLENSRPLDTPSRHLFVSASSPYSKFTASSAIRYLLIKYAGLAGVSAPYLGSHVIRHSYARKQLEIGTQVKVIGDILGHRRPSSTSAYIRISTTRLRDLALDVPQ